MKPVRPNPLAAQRGSVIVVVALLLPVLLAVVGLVLDSGMLYMTRRQLQTAADSAAMTGAISKIRGLSPTTAADRDAANNGYTTGVTVNNPPLSGANVGNSSAVEVIISKSVPTAIMQIFGFGPTTVTARAVASASNQPGPCVLVLNKGDKADALSMGGTPSLQTNNCPLVVNGDNGNMTAHVWGSATVNTGTSYFGVQSSNSGGVSNPEFPITNQPPAVDPYCDLNFPHGDTTANNGTPGLGLSAQTGGNFSSGTLPAGIYSSGVTIKGPVQMSGNYYFTGASAGLTVQANGSLSMAPSSPGVTIFMTGGASFNEQGSPTVSLSAPTSGTYANILFFGDRGAGTSNNTNCPPPKSPGYGLADETGAVMNFGGGSSSTFVGAVYFPDQGAQVSMNGGNGTNMYIIADMLSLNGNNSINSNNTIPNPSYYNPVASLVE